MELKELNKLARQSNNSRLNKPVSGQGYCRKCQRTISLDKFYDATNAVLDANGKMSICSDCCNGLFDDYFKIYNNFEVALQLTCQDLDVRLSKEAIKQVQSQLETAMTKGKNIDKVFGTYKSKLSSTGKKNSGMQSFRYKDSDYLIDDKEIFIDENIDEDFLLFWGKGFDDIDDYIFLETELSNWKKTHKCDNQAELTLLREICIKILEIRKARENKDSVGNLQKELQDLMKTASVDPAKANAASAGKSHDAFGIWVKDIEQFRPAEWFDQQEKYKDMDGFIPYIKNYIVRPIENFLTGVRNFLVDDNIDADLDSVDVGNVEGDTNG
jgi:hypothetical protein